MNTDDPSGTVPPDAAPTLPLVSAECGEGRKLNTKQRKHLIGLFGFIVVLIVLFWNPLVALIRHAAKKEIHSHIVLIPFITAYLISIKRRELPTDYQCSPGWAIVPLLGGVAAWVARWNLTNSASLSHNDSLALVSLSFILLSIAGGFLFLGKKWMLDAAFPLAFLVFAIPLPDGVVDGLETASKLASTEAADWLFSATRTPVLREGTVFQMPGIVIQVAQECSGIRSSFVLFITSLLASHLFLKSPWRRFLLVAFVIPLGIIRNGFRILVISLLCIHMGPHMIDSAIHHKGGPLFFGMSLIPLFLLLWWLRRGERSGGRSQGVGSQR